MDQEESLQKQKVEKTGLEECSRIMPPSLRVPYALCFVAFSFQSFVQWSFDVKENKIISELSQIQLETFIFNALSLRLINLAFTFSYLVSESILAS